MKKPNFKNMWKTTKKKSLHRRKSSLWMGAFLVVFLIVLSCGVLFAGETVPENPIEDKEEGFDTASVIMNCESDEDDNVYVPVPVATEPDQSPESENSDSGVNGQEKQQQDPKEEDPQQEEQETPPEQIPQEEKITKPAASARSDKNNDAAPNGDGGNSGGTDPGGEKTDKIYFTTNIRDGEEVTNKVLSITITDKYPKELKRTNVTVILNDTEVPQFNGKVELKEGENTINILVTYMDRATGKIVGTFAPPKPYTVILNTKDLVIETDLQDGAETHQSYFSFKASASYKGTSASLSVELNGKTVKSKGKGTYDVWLQEGKNTFTLKASGGGLEKEETYAITYAGSGEPTIETTLPDSTEDENLEFEVRVTGVPASKVDGITLTSTTAKIENVSKDKSSATYKYRASLKPGQNKISIRVKYDGNMLEPNIKSVTLTRKAATPEDPFPDGDRSPRITEIDISDGMQTSSSTMNMLVHAVDYKGNNLNANNVTVLLNGSQVMNPWLNNGAMTFQMKFVSGENQVEIYLKDAEDYEAYYSYRIIYTPVTGPVGNALVSVEATTVGLGYIIPPTSIPFYDDEPASYVVDRLLKANNMTYEYGGSFDNGFYLRRIHKEGLMANFSIPENLRKYLDDYGVFLEEDKYDPDSLGEKDFIPSGSGWMVAVDGHYTGYGFSDMRLKDGAVVKIRFTLYMGKDIGDDSAASGSQPFPEIFVEP